MGLGNLLRNIEARGLKDITNPEVVKAYMDWNVIKLKGLHLDADDIISFAEQVVYRRTTCTECVKNGECLHCHCPIDAKMATPLSSCSMGFWEKMKPREEWEKEKEEKGIEFIKVQTK